MLCLIHEVGRNDILVWYGRWAGQIDLLLALILHVPGHTASFCTFTFDFRMKAKNVNAITFVRKLSVDFTQFCEKIIPVQQLFQSNKTMYK